MNHLFPIKFFSLLTALKSMSGYGNLVTETKDMSLPLPEDGNDRIVLCSPALISTMSEEVGYEHIRVRLVFPKELTLTNAANSPLVEVYEMKKDQVKKASLSISQLSKTAALALENELFYLITKNAGVNIPMM